jgi:uncharacterized protein YeaO (DUF488 family)
VLKKLEVKIEKERQIKEAAYQQKKYWDEHPEEYQAELNRKKHINDQIAKLTEERNSLGFFSIKQKNEIDSEIQLLNKELNK